ncbi:MAG: cupin domain-containing protein [Clostridiales bacterium]|nr:cupin domain-containing protein [Clostridiales bacterium]
MFISSSQTTSQKIEGLRGGPGEVVKTDWTDAFPPNLTMLSTLTLESGSGIGYHPHDTNTEVFYILDGELEIDDNGEPHTAKAGDVVITGGGQGHSVMNQSGKPAVMLAFIVI